MHILNRLRKLVKDTSDTITNKLDKIDYLRWWTDFYNINITTKDIEITTETTTDDISAGSNTITVADITKYTQNKKLVIFDNTNEESVYITSIDETNSKITFSTVNDFAVWSTIFPDLLVSYSEKDIVVYYAASLIEEVSSSTSTSWAKTSWKQWEITYTTENTSWKWSTSNYMERALKILEENTNYIKRWSNWISFRKVAIT